MKHLLPPESWRTEAFAEDLFTEQRARAPSPGVQFGRISAALIGVLPIALAAVGAVWAVLGRAV